MMQGISSSATIHNAPIFWRYLFPINILETPPNAAFIISSSPVSTIKVHIKPTKLIKADPGNVDHNTVQLVIISEDDIRLSYCVGKLLVLHNSCQHSSWLFMCHAYQG